MERFFTSNNIIISVAGNFDFPAVIELLEKHFENFNVSEKIPLRPAKKIKSGLICQYRKLEQVHFYLATLGLKANDPQRYECYLLNAIMGGSMSSRLFQKIREERGLAYSINSGNSQYHDAGIFSVYAATGTKNYLAVLELIIKEFNDIKNNKIDETELEKAKNQLKGLLMLSLESSESRMFQLAKEEIFFGRHFTLDEILGGINKVTAPGIKRLGSKLFKSQFYNLALIGPIKKNKALEEVLHS
jgi:predicted Zn-dependent peptidase